MTFWQENYGFVKEVYDYRMAKYQEWMDNLESIVNKVLAPNVQYTYKEFKIIQDTLTSLCRDLEKEGMKEWLDMMLEKVAMRVSEEGGSSRDKEFKSNERKRLQALIDRHDKLMPPTRETQEKVEVFARCYAYGDDISHVLKTLEEMRHLSVKEIHPHNMNMVEEQIEKAEKVITTIQGVQDQYDEYLKRGHKLLKTPNCAPFLAALIEKLELAWKESNEKSKERLTMLTTTVKDWEKYDELRAAIIDPLEKLEGDYKKYRKFYDPAMGAKKLAQKKTHWEECKAKSDEMFENIKKCYITIIVLAGEDKKEFLDKEVAEVEDKRSIIGKCQEKMKQLEEYNDQLTKAVSDARALNDWAKPTEELITALHEDTVKSPEDRVKEILAIQEEANQKFPTLEPLAETYKKLLTEEDLEKSETAKNTVAEFDEIKKYVTLVYESVEKEASSISQDQRFYADYLCGIKEFKPWIDDAEKKTKEALAKPVSLNDALALLSSCEEFNSNCVQSKEKLDAAAKARESMEKASSTVNEAEPLGNKWTDVKKIAEDRVQKVQKLVGTWQELQNTTTNLAERMNELPKQNEPNIDEIEKIFTSMKDLFSKKKDLLSVV